MKQDNLEEDSRFDSSDVATPCKEKPEPNQIDNWSDWSQYDDWGKRWGGGDAGWGDTCKMEFEDRPKPKMTMSGTGTKRLRLAGAGPAVETGAAM